MTMFHKTMSPRKWMGLLCIGAVLVPAAWAQAGRPIDFTITEGRVVPSEDFAVKVEVLGAAITSGGEDTPAADFQDLVVLITLGTSPEAPEEDGLADATYD